ncbi:sigma-54-dependent transcriptional regulator [Desulfotomaculum sp. 1211_IL3151]|uniref:sigma-54-dependent transcriptional regulator n=1 Tax=Desulfotomaculum sp. 1211_IL3151 TaxID=3084055 RepID=UPI002FD9AF57
MELNILIVDDEKLIQNLFKKILKQSPYQVVLAGDIKAALGELAKKQFNLALIDLMLPDGSGLELLEKIKKSQPNCKCIIMTGYGTLNTAVHSIQLGAYDYLEKPFGSVDELRQIVSDAVVFDLDKDEQIHLIEDLAYQTGLVVGQGHEMRQLIKTAYKLASKNVSVLITGETGTGKELLARFIHNVSGRKDQVFIPINCGAFSENLLESELFGHEKGAFTGSSSTKKGIFELAHRGTLLLDELAEASPGIQVKLLRVLETGDFMRVGGEDLIHCDVRIIAATNGNIEGLVRNNHFREDLYYRLNVARLELPPLRKRTEDIPYLVRHFYKKITGNHYKNISLSHLALEVFQSYHWPGNLRELYNIIQQVLFTEVSNKIDLKHLPKEMLGSYNKQTDSLGRVEESPHIPPNSGEFIPKTLAEVEKEYIEKTMRHFNGNISLAAEALGLSRATLYRKIKQ